MPGARSMRNHPTDNLEFALIADGVPKDKRISDALLAAVHLTENGKLLLEEGSVDIGGSRASMALIAAETLAPGVFMPAARVRRLPASC